MSLLVVAKTWESPSELWLQRMLEGLAPYTAVIAAEKGAKPYWRGKIPGLSLEARPRLWRKAVRALGIKIPVASTRAVTKRLIKAVNDRSISAILVHYLTVAVKFERVWETTKKPLFVHCHGSDMTWDMRSMLTPEKKNFDEKYFTAVRRLAERATFIVNSHTSAKRFEEINVPPERIVVKYMGVEVPPAPPQRPARTKELNVLYLGRLTDCKGPDLVINAFDLACARGFDGRLIMAGDGPMRMMCEVLRARSRYRDQITMLGAVSFEEGTKLRAEADIFTAHNCLGPLTHQEEAFGVSIAEAMAAALPVVSGANGSLPELISHRTNGILVTPGDVEAHADALVELARAPELRRQLGEAAWRKAQQDFTVEQEQRRLLEILGLDTSRPLNNRR